MARCSRRGVQCSRSAVWLCALTGLMKFVAMMLKRKADAPIPEMIAPCTVPFFDGNHLPPVINGIWYATPTPRPKSTE